MIQELSPEKLRKIFDSKALGIHTTEKLKPLEGIIGQKRAVSALEFGLGIEEHGFNIYVAGPPGIGKMTAVKSFLERFARSRETPLDFCYVNNFEDPYRPKVLSLPAGKGRRLQKDLKNLVVHVRREVPKVFESEEYGVKRDEILKALDKEREQVFKHLNEKAAHAGFVPQATPLGVLVLPLREGKPMSEAEVRALPKPEQEDLERRREALKVELKASLKKIRERERLTQEKLQELDRDVALYIVEDLMEDLLEKYHDLTPVIEHLKVVQKDVLESIETFKSPQETQGTPTPEENPPTSQVPKDHPFHKYEVNLFVDNSKKDGAPVIVDLNPTYTNLFGRIEKETHYGALYTDFTMVKAGSIHRANGGYLVLPIEDLLRNFFSWDGLKRALRGREVQIEELGERMGFLSTKSLRPDPIPLTLKVVLVGRTLLYHLLHAYDEEFSELFKVKADFDIRIDRSEENIEIFTRFLTTLCEKEKLRHLDGSAVAKILEHASRIAEDQEKLSTHFGVLADLIREASYWAKESGASHVSGVHVKKALDEKVYRSNLIEERIQEMIARGTLLIDTAGEAVGQVNGLSVTSLGDYLFGRPSRITASVGPGRGGIVDIEREVELGGPIHSKGVLILSGFLAQRFAKDMPLTLSARLVFEQSYEGVEGDSASSTELYALLSALSGLPIKQGIAVTGSVNQQGEVQAIGGVNQKIEGFFDVCKTKELTGEQGVLIPLSNLQNIMLREDVVEAVKSKKFHIWAVKTIDEGIEVLTGVPAGERESNGQFPEGTVNSRVDETLRKFAESLRDFPEVEERPKSKRKSPSRKKG